MVFTTYVCIFIYRWKFVDMASLAFSMLQGTSKGCFWIWDIFWNKKLWHPRLNTYMKKKPFLYPMLIQFPYKVHRSPYSSTCKQRLYFGLCRMLLGILKIHGDRLTWYFRSVKRCVKYLPRASWLCYGIRNVILNIFFHIYMEVRPSWNSFKYENFMGTKMPC